MSTGCFRRVGISFVFIGLVYLAGDGRVAGADEVFTGPASPSGLCEDGFGFPCEMRPDCILDENTIALGADADGLGFELWLVHMEGMPGVFEVTVSGERQGWTPMLLVMAPAGAAQESVQVPLENILPEPISEQAWLEQYGGSLSEPGSMWGKTWWIGDWSITVGKIERFDGSIAVRIIIKHREESGHWTVVFDSGWIELRIPSQRPHYDTCDEAWLAAWSTIIAEVRQAGPEALSALREAAERLWEEYGELLEAEGFSKPQL